MGMATGIDEAYDAEAVADWDAAHEVGQGAVIIGMDCTGAFRPAAGTGGASRVGHDPVYGRHAGV